MPSSIDPSQVRKLADLPAVEIIPDANLQVFIDAAYLIRTEDLEGNGLTTERLDMIELYLAAHFAILTHEKGGLTSQVVGQSEDRYQQMNSKMYGLSASRFGQVALSLDTTGTLTSLASSPLKAQFRVI